MAQIQPFHLDEALSNGSLHGSFSNGSLHGSLSNGLLHVSIPDGSLRGSMPGNNPTDSDEEEAVDVVHDPAFIPRGMLFPFNEPSEQSDSEPPLDATIWPTALSDHPVVREAYIHAFAAWTFGGNTNMVTHAMLESSRSTIASTLTTSIPSSFSSNAAIICLAASTPDST